MRGKQNLVSVLVGSLIWLFFPVWTSCQKEEKVELETRNRSLYMNHSVSLNSLIPELDQMGFDPAHMCYCMFLPVPPLDYSFSIGRTWADAQEIHIPVSSNPITIPDGFPEPVTTQYTMGKSVTIGGFHWPEIVKTIDYAIVSGTLTIHISFPADFPFEKVTLVQFSRLRLPPCLGIASQDNEEWIVSTDSGGATVTNRVPRVIPRTGLDLELQVGGISQRQTQWQRAEDGTLALTGTINGFGELMVSPEDATEGVSNVKTIPLDFHLVFSELEFISVSGVLEDPKAEEIVATVPLPVFADENLNHFTLAEVEAHFTADRSSFGFDGRFFSKGNGVSRTSETTEISYPSNFLYLEQWDGIYREGLNQTVCPGLNALVQDPVPAELGVGIRLVRLPNYFYPGQSEHFKLSCEWRVPLILTGANWGKTYKTDPFELSNLFRDAAPGTEVSVVGWVENHQPFDLKCIPVIVDDDGKEHELDEDAIVVKGGATFLNLEKEPFVAHWQMEENPCGHDLYLKFVFGECSSFSLTPDQYFQYGLRGIYMQVIKNP